MKKKTNLFQGLEIHLKTAAGRKNLKDDSTNLMMHVSTRVGRRKGDALRGPSCRWVCGRPEGEAAADARDLFLVPDLGAEMLSLGNGHSRLGSLCRE